MKVIVVCGAGLVSGKEIMTLALLKGLKERNVECSCITASWGSHDFRKRLQELEIPFVVMRLGFISKTLKWSAVRMTLHQLIYMPGLYLDFRRMRKANRDAVWIHTNFHHLFLLMPVLPANRNIYWSHEIIGPGRFYKKMFRAFNRKVDRFVGVSDAVAASIKPLVDPGKVMAVKNGIVPLARRSRKQSPAAVTLGIIGQLASLKGHEVVFRALKNYRHFSKSVQLIIVGGGDAAYIAYLRQLADELQVSEIIQWRGFVRGTDNIYSDIDVVVVPSVVPDSYPTTIMESGFLGIPVVASSIGGIPEMIRDGYNGFLFQPGDSVALEAVLKRILTIDLAPISANAIAFAEGHFTEKDFIDNFTSLLGTI